MSSIRIPLPSAQLAAGVLSEIPDEARRMFRRGFSIVGKLPLETQQKIINRAIESLEEQVVSLAPADLQKQLELSEQDTEAVLGAVMLLTSGVAAQASGISSEDVVAELAKAKAIDTEDIPQIELLYGSLKGRAHELESRVERSQLAARILPAFRRSRSAVDLRVSSAEKRLAVVVGLVHIHTDSRDASINFQITTPLLGKLIKDLQALQREMGEAEKLISVWEKK
jgi:hypothetical protein